MVVTEEAATEGAVTEVVATSEAEEVTVLVSEEVAFITAVDLTEVDLMVAMGSTVGTAVGGTGHPTGVD